MLDCLLIGAGGFVGTVLRYLIGCIPGKPGNDFPVKTLIINVAGAFFIGAIAALSARDRSLNPHIILMLKVGVCGGFTTFSTFAFESAGLMQKGQSGLAFLYVFLSIVLGISAVFAAQAIIR